MTRQVFDWDSLSIITKARIHLTPSEKWGDRRSYWCGCERFRSRMLFDLDQITLCDKHRP